MEEKKEIIINENGVRIRGFEPTDALAYLTEALCHVWDREVGNINVSDAGIKVIDALHESEKNYKLDILWDMMAEDSEDEDDD